MYLDKKRYNVALLEVRDIDVQLYHFARRTMESRGPRGFVITFKALKAWALQILSGTKDYHAEWFSYKRYKGYTIPLRTYTCFKKIIDAAGHRDFGLLRRLLSALNIHAIVDGPIDEDIINSVSTVKSPPPTVSPAKSYFWKRLIELSVAAVNLPRYHGQIGRPRPTGQTVALEPRINGTWKDYLLQNKTSAGSYVLHTDARSPYWAGNFGVVGDVGGKTRLIAIGTPESQGMLGPLKDWLLLVISSLPWDCTFNQEHGLQVVSEWSRRRRKMFSVDLKDATWHFPAVLQRIMCHSLGVNDKLINLLFNASFTSKWTEEWVHPIKGQAMGLGPSFPLFALTHGMILYGICRWVGVNPVESFVVLGDDVVISEESVYNMYIDFLNTWDVPISKNKTFISDYCAEFAGGFIWHGRDIRPIKWRKILPLSGRALIPTYRKIVNHWTYLTRGTESDFQALWALSPSLGGFGLRETRLSPSGLAKRYAFLSQLERTLQERTPINFGLVSYPIDISQMPFWVPESFEDEGIGPDDEQLRALQRMLETPSVDSWIMRFSPKPTSFANQLGMDLGELLPVRPKAPGAGQLPFLRPPKGYNWNDHQKTVLNLLLERRQSDEENSSKEKTALSARTETVGVWNGKALRLERVGDRPGQASRA